MTARPIRWAPLFAHARELVCLGYAIHWANYLITNDVAIGAERLTLVLAGFGYPVTSLLDRRRQQPRLVATANGVDDTSGVPAPG